MVVSSLKVYIEILEKLMWKNGHFLSTYRGPQLYTEHKKRNI